MRVLDEVAAAVREARRKYPRPVLSAFGLEEQFGAPVTPEQWATIERALGCELPPLEFVGGHWFLPDGFGTVWDLVDHACDYHPDWDPPAERTVAAWRNAQVFAGVREALADAGGLDPEQIVREARLKRDLGLE